MRGYARADKGGPSRVSEVPEDVGLLDGRFFHSLNHDKAVSFVFTNPKRFDRCMDP